MSRVLELSDEEYARLEQAAREHGNTIAELVHRWISGMTNEPPQSSSDIMPANVDDPWRGFYEAFESTNPDLVERHDYYIGQEALNPHNDEGDEDTHAPRP